MSLRSEFCHLACQKGIAFAQLCQRFGISRKTGYKWLLRYRESGEAGLSDRSRRPHCSPGRTAAAIERQVLELRAPYHWGGRKISHLLRERGVASLGASTVTDILRRHGQLNVTAREHGPWQRFEHPEPNDLWQMDFKGHFATDLGRCHPLTVLDDHSRFSVICHGCDNQTAETVKTLLIDAFRRYGLPRRILCDNGSPWGCSDEMSRHTRLTAWLLRIGVGVCHGRPFHPQTQGKDERFNRTLDSELIGTRRFRDTLHFNQLAAEWREIYNHLRPHEALGLQSPIKRYCASPRAYPEVLPPLQYSPGDQVRKVDRACRIFYRNRRFRIGHAFVGEYVALRPAPQEGVMDVFYCHQKIRTIDLSVMQEQ